MPFAGYADFADCVRKNAKKDNPRGYCAVIQRRVERPMRETDVFAEHNTPNSPHREHMKTSRVVAGGRVEEQDAIAVIGPNGQRLYVTGQLVPPGAASRSRTR